MHLRAPREFHIARISSNLRSYGVLRRLLRGGQAASGAALEGVELRALDGNTVRLRPGTSDATVVWETFVGRYHLPPDELTVDTVGMIWDLGSNIGLTAAHMAVLYPRARIVGVELDPENAALARENLEPWRERCEVVQAAVWVEDGEIRYAGTPGEEYGFRVGASAGMKVSPTISLDAILRRDGVGIDYVKMDIEGAEREVLRSQTSWAAAVRTIKVEVHGGYTVEDCAADLARLGFRVRIDHRHWACAVGVRA